MAFKAQFEDCQEAIDYAKHVAALERALVDCVKAIDAYERDDPLDKLWQARDRADDVLRIQFKG